MSLRIEETRGLLAPPTIEEQIDAVEWAEAHVAGLARLAALSSKQQIGARADHAKALSNTQLAALRQRLEAAVQTLFAIAEVRKTK